MKYITLTALLCAITLPGCTIWAVGDASDSAESASVARLIPRGSPFIYLGDVYEYGTASDFVDNFQSVWGRFRTPLSMPTPGNHDWANHATGYDPWWGSAAPQTNGGHWYSKSAGGWTILSINSEEAHGPGSAQLAWVQQQAARPGTCKIAFWHSPRYSAGDVGDSPDMQPIWTALAGHAIVALSGHGHAMEQMVSRDGITQLVSGAGGHSRHPLYLGDPDLAWGDDTRDGALKLTLSDGKVSWAFVGTDGSTLHSGASNCVKG